MLVIQMTIKDTVFLYRNTKRILTPFFDKTDLEIIYSKFADFLSCIQK